MAEQTYREIQLTRKQLVFLFMSSVVVLFVAFLLGVSVGRSVGAPDGVLAGPGTALDSDTLVTTQQPPTETEPGELSYHDDLQGGASTTGGSPARAAGDQPAGQVSTDPIPDDPLPTAPPPPEPDPVTPAAAATPPPPPPPPTTTTTPPASQTRPAASGAWALQLGAFNSRPNANNLVAELKGKGYAAFVERTDDDSMFAVRVGPFQTRPQAEGMRQKLAADPSRYESLIISR